MVWEGLTDLYKCIKAIAPCRLLAEAILAWRQGL